LKKYFGTDGIRGRANTRPLTVDFVLKLGRLLQKSLEMVTKSILLSLVKIQESLDIFMRMLLLQAFALWE